MQENLRLHPLKKGLPLICTTIPALLLYHQHLDSANKEKILDGILQINLDYEIESTNVRNNIVYPFYFAEGTKIT